MKPQPLAQAKPATTKKEILKELQTAINDEREYLRSLKKMIVFDYDDTDLVKARIDGLVFARDLVKQLKTK